MSVITSIKPQKNNKRVNIYLDGKFGFGIDLENFVKLGLKVEQSLEDEEIKKIIKKAEFQKTYDYLLKFAMLRPRSEKEIIDDVLSKIKINEEEIARDLLGKKLYRWKALTDLEKKRKMGEFLARKGFGWDIIKKVT